MRLILNAKARNIVGKIASENAVENARENARENSGIAAQSN